MPSKAAAQTEQPAPTYKHSLQFVPSAWAKRRTLDGSVKELLRKLLKKRLNNPHVPGALLWHYKIKPDKQGYRLVYGVQDGVLIVMVMALDKREDSVVYQSALQRVAQKRVELPKAVQKRL